MGIVESSFTCAVAEDTTTVVGDRGTIVQSFGDGPSCGPIPIPEGTKGLKFARAGESAWTVVDIPSPTNHIQRIQGVARPGVEFLMGRRDPIATAEEGKDNVACLLAAYESALAGRRVTLS